MQSCGKLELKSDDLQMSIYNTLPRRQSFPNRNALHPFDPDSATCATDFFRIMGDDGFEISSEEPQGQHPGKTDPVRGSRRLAVVSGHSSCSRQRSPVKYVQQHHRPLLCGPMIPNPAEQLHGNLVKLPSTAGPTSSGTESDLNHQASSMTSLSSVASRGRHSPNTSHSSSLDTSECSDRAFTSGHPNIECKKNGGTASQDLLGDKSDSPTKRPLSNHQGQHQPSTDTKKRPLTVTFEDELEGDCGMEEMEETPRKHISEVTKRLWNRGLMLSPVADLLGLGGNKMPSKSLSGGSDFVRVDFVKSGLKSRPLPVSGSGQERGAPEFWKFVQKGR